MCSNKSNQYWALAMAMGEANHYDGAGGMSALATAGKDCTHADVWRASTRVVAYGRKKIAAAAAEGAPAGQTTMPAATTVVPAAIANAPAAIANAPAATAVALPTLPDAATQIMQLDAQQQLAIAAPGAPGQAKAAKRKREAAEPPAPAKTLEQPQSKRMKQLSQKASQLRAAAAAGTLRARGAATRSLHRLQCSQEKRTTTTAYISSG